MQGTSVVVVSGLPGVGKSTTARELARRFERAAHVEADLLQGLIVSGAVWPDVEGIGAEARRQLDLRLRNACLLARSFTDAGFTAIVDDIVIGEAVEVLPALLGEVDFRFVMLVPEFAQVKQRWIDMGSPFAHAWDWIDEIIRNETRRIGLWLDTTDLDLDQTVDAIVEYLRSQSEA